MTSVQAEGGALGREVEVAVCHYVMNLTFCTQEELELAIDNMIKEGRIMIPKRQSDVVISAEEIVHELVGGNTLKCRSLSMKEGAGEKKKLTIFYVGDFDKDKENSEDKQIDPKRRKLITSHTRSTPLVQKINVNSIKTATSTGRLKNRMRGRFSTPRKIVKSPDAIELNELEQKIKKRKEKLSSLRTLSVWEKKGIQNSLKPLIEKWLSAAQNAAQRLCDKYSTILENIEQHQVSSASGGENQCGTAGRDPEVQGQMPGETSPYPLGRMLTLLNISHHHLRYNSKEDCFE
eukprot:Nk52_evm23s156 gene=Nk52_evmTU23s156